MCNGVRKPISPGLKNLGGREREGDKRAPKSFPRPPFFFFFSFFCPGSCFQASTILYTVYKINKLSNLPFIINKSFDSIISCSDTQTYNNYDCRQS